jgi:hypothetical protein
MTEVMATSAVLYPDAILMARVYNDNPHRFSTQLGITRATRINRLSPKVTLQVNTAGTLVVVDKGRQCYVAPDPDLVPDEISFHDFGHTDIFTCDGKEQGVLHQRFELMLPAIFQKETDGTFTLISKGLLKLE